MSPDGLNSRGWTSAFNLTGILKMNSENQGIQKIVDFRLPFTWLVGAAIGLASSLMMLGWQAAGQSNKMDSLIDSNSKLEKRLDERDVRIETLRDSLFAQQRLTDANTLRITSLEARVRP